MPRPVGEATSYEVHLITGDHVLVEVGPSGDHSVAFGPAGRRPGAASYQYHTIDNQLYVIPSDAASLIPDVLDLELFNVTKLHESGYAEATPVIVQHAPGLRTVPTAAAEGPETAAGLEVTAELSSINGVAGTVTDERWWQAASGRTASGASTLAQAGALLPAGPLPGVQRVWLDEVVQVDLADSVPQTGAPQAWQAGYDGSGMTVAVLDTGIDADHPDLAGKVVAERNFTSEESAADGHGHGSHVASTIAGSGAASDGARRGVAPGAQLINGKVLDNNGNGQTSWVMAGMEWAAANADVVNMSLGAGATDGTDPVSAAVNSLTEQHGTLFVISAGNSGPPDRSVGAPGAADAALTVGAVDKDGQLADFSSRGPRRGDWAVKPDITAPGVGIVAARAAGTAMGSPVDADYTSANGTSMAAPHVAGAAAIVLQHDPDLTPAQAKSVLVGSADPHGGLHVYQQGGGQLDLPAALATPVLADQAPLNLGLFEYPHDDAEAVYSEISYTNRGDETVTLALSAQVSRIFGPPLADGLLTLDPATLTVPPGQTVTADITLEVPDLPIGLYGGYLLAEQDGELVARTPVGFHKEDEMYDIIVTGVNRAGDPAGGKSNFAVFNVDDLSRYIRPGFEFVNGEFLARVPPGTYAVLGAIIDHDERGEFLQSATFLGDPEVSVTEDTTLHFDARDGVKVEVVTPAHETAPIGGKAFGYWRSTATPGPFFNPTWRMRDTSTELYVAETDPVTQGEFEFHSKWRLAAPEAKLSIVHPTGESLDPYLLRAPAVDGEQVVSLVDVGAGAQSDFAGVDVSGAAALVSRHHGDPQFYLEQERFAAEAGAVALLVANDVPGHLTGHFVDEGTIPTLSVRQGDGQRLRELLAGGEVRVRLDGTVWSDYLYDLMLVEQDHLPAGPRYVLSPADLVTIEMTYHNDLDDHVMSEGRSASRPYHTGSVFQHPSVEGPRTRTEYLVGGDEVGYRHTVYGETPFGARLEEATWYEYESGRTYHKHAFRQVVRPALLPHDPTTRTEDTVQLRLFQWVDAAGMYFPTNTLGVAPPAYDTITTRVFRDGELLGTIDGTPRADVVTVADRAQYRVEIQTARDVDWWTRSTQTRTEWTFTSQRPDADTELLPLLSVDYLLPLDARNATPHPRDFRGPANLRLNVYQQDDSLPDVAGARVWVSYDDGGRWQQRPVRELGDGQFQVNLPSRPASGGADAVSVRVDAWDTAGNRIEQEVLRAWHLPGR